MPTCLNQIGGDSCLPERLAGFQAMKPFNQNKAVAIRSHENGHFLTLFHHAPCKSFNLLRIKRLTPLHGHIDVLDREDLLLQCRPDCSDLRLMLNQSLCAAK